MPAPTIDAITAALAPVNDPEINRPVTDLGMVKSVEVADAGTARVGIYLTVSGCPMRGTITDRVREAVSAVPGVTAVEVELDVMSDEQRAALRTMLRGHEEREIPFSQPGSLTKVFAIASGKGGVGKSSLTVNLAIAFQQLGLEVGVIDADGYGAPELKIAVFNFLVRDEPLEFAGIKLFYKQDEPLMTPAEVLALTPSPDVIIYQ